MKDKTPVATAEPEVHHPMEHILRMDRIPHIWCPTCGLGTVVTSLAAALEKNEIPLDEVAVVSGIGCTGRVAGYVKVDSFHTTHGRPIPFATGLKLANPKLNVIVVSGDGDLIAIGGNHFIHSARRNMDITVICVNNFIYAMTGGQVAPTTPLTANASTMPYGNFEPPFNIPYLADSCGAVYVARWSSLHVRRMTTAIAEAMAPSTKTSDTHQPSMGTKPRATATTATNITRTRYSRLRKASAPSLIAADISRIRCEPWSCFST